MKKQFFSIALILSFAFGFQLTAQQDSCLKLIYPHDPANGYYNLDSVMVDTCTNSTTYRLLFTKKSITIILKTYIFKFKQSNFDTLFRWDAIDSSFLTTLNGFKNLEQNFGTFYFKRCNYFGNTADSEYKLITLIFDKNH